MGMMLIPIANVSQFTPGSPTIIKLERAYTLDKLKLELSGGLLPSHITGIWGKTNGRIFMEDTGPNNALRMAYKNITVAPNSLVLDFTEPKARGGAIEQLQASIPCNLLQDITFEFQIAASAPATGRIKAFASVRAPTTNPFIRKLMKSTQDASFIGQHEIWLPYGDMGGITKRIWFHESAANQITDVFLMVNGYRICEATRVQIESEERENGLVPQAGMFCFDFVADGNLSGALNTRTGWNGEPLRQVSLRMNVASAGPITRYLELVDPIGNL